MSDVPSFKVAKKELAQAVRNYIVDERVGPMYEDEIRASTLQYYAGEFIRAGGNPIDVVRVQRDYAQSLNASSALGKITGIIREEYPDVVAREPGRVDWVSVKLSMGSAVGRTFVIAGLCLFSLFVAAGVNFLAETPDDKMPEGSMSVIVWTCVVGASLLLAIDFFYSYETGNETNEDWTGWAVLGYAFGVGLVIFLYLKSVSPGAGKWWLTTILAVLFYGVRVARAWAVSRSR